MALGAIGGFNPLAMLGGMAATKAVDAISSIFASPGRSQPAAGSSALQQLPLDQDARQQFLDFAGMDETGTLQLAWFEKNDLTAEKLAGMDAQQRAGLEEDLRQNVEEHVRARTGKTAGGLADLVV